VLDSWGQESVVKFSTALYLFNDDIHTTGGIASNVPSRTIRGLYESWLEHFVTPFIIKPMNDLLSLITRALLSY
jgi:hypothetical protein